MPTGPCASLHAGCHYGILAGMNSPLRKITVQVHESDLERAQKYTGEGVTETLRLALRNLASAQAQRELLAYRGKVTFTRTWEELKEDR